MSESSLRLLAQGGRDAGSDHSDGVHESTSPVVDRGLEGGARRPHMTRAIVQHTRGRTHGPTTRLMSPSDLGKILRPFGAHSVHSTPAALRDAQAHLAAIRPRLVQEGRL